MLTRHQPRAQACSTARRRGLVPSNFAINPPPASRCSAVAGHRGRSTTTAVQNGHASLIPWTLRSLARYRDVATIASGRAIRELRRLRRRYGKGRWRKRKGWASVRLLDGTVHRAELHWYEAHGVGRREMKIKFPLLD
jgi:hypothetical protein